MAASYACDAQTLGTAKRYKRPTLIVGAPMAPAPIVDVTFNNDRFKASLAELDTYLPADPQLFYGAGVRLSPLRCPRRAFSAYRRGLGYIARTILNCNADGFDARLPDADGEKYWKLLLLYDGLVLGPAVAPGDFAELARERCGLFLAGDWGPLFREHISYRDASFRPSAQPTYDDPKDAMANRAQYILDRKHCVGGASAALRAPKTQRVAFPGQMTSTFAALNPQIDDPVPRPPPGGGDYVVHHDIYRDDPPLRRRPLQPPNMPSPPPIVFSTAEIIKRVRRASTSSAGGLSGTDYRTLRVWFAEPDAIADDLTALINLLAAGKVPQSVVPLLTAGRGVGIPKNDKGELRPIVIGYVLLRLIGSAAVAKLSPDISAYFLQPKALQFGVGVPGGCEIMAAAINAHLEIHQDHIDISCDARNAFNSWCRTRLWGPLHDKFPSLYAFTKLLYGQASDIIFYEDGQGLTSIINAVRSR